MGQWSRESFEKALGYFRLAVEKDPTHALAYAHMADCYGMLGHGGHRPFLDAFQSAKQAALHALALDDGLSTAHWAVSRGHVDLRLEFGHMRSGDAPRHSTKSKRRRT